jgi:DNA-directed RNA polymerase subunit RPC12/RpoP
VATGGYRCPNCGSTYPPIAEKRISTEGWIVFCALLVFCLPLFWIGLLMKEELRVCPMCRARLA